MMTDLENLLSIIHRTGYERMPVSFQMTPFAAQRFDTYLKEHPMEIPWATGAVLDAPAWKASPEEITAKYFVNKQLKPGATVDFWGVAHEPGSAAAYHMTYMRHPMENFDSVEQIQSYPFPMFDDSGFAALRDRVQQLHAKGQAAEAYLHCTVWETSWYLRGMENLMCDMMTDDPMATALLDAVTDIAVKRAKSFARAGADILFLGDDIGTQRAIMMSVSLYEEWLMPRLKRVVDAARAIKPDIVIQYHSCGLVTELIPSLIKAGVQVLDPVQPEVMDFKMLQDRFGDRLSFHGTIGTQTVMPFGTPQDVRAAVFKYLDIAGPKGGLLVCPTHVLEPEVPPENIAAYIQACVDYTK